jgi:transcriptional regulator with XRE-family HTH domain
MRRYRTYLSSSVRPDGKRLEQMRLKAGMTVYAVAEKLHTTPQAIAAAEASKLVGSGLVARLENLYTSSVDDEAS